MRTLYPGILGIACCASVLVCSIPTFAQSSSAASGKDQRTTQVEPAASMQLPDSPGSVLARLQEPGGSGTGTSQEQNPAPSQAPPAQDQKNQEQHPQRPVGTAAAEAPKVTGITAAQPAGVAIAPAKQRRVRTIVLKVGAIVAGGAALGTVIALTAATPSKPPGAH